MIPPEVAAMLSRRQSRPESRLAAALLKSKTKPRYELWCGRRDHRLGAVYLAKTQQLILAVPQLKFLRAHFYEDVEPDDTQELAYPPWSYLIPEPDDGSDPFAGQWIPLRCRCHSYWTSVLQLQQKIAFMVPGDSRILVGIMTRRQMHELNY